MPVYDQQVARADVPISPEESAEVIKASADTSVMLRKARRARMSTKVKTQPVLATLPQAYWVNGDTGLKQTTKVTWDSLTITAEELAVLCPVPNALVDDSSIPIWSEVRPLLAEAIGVKVDLACLYGTDKPATFPAAIIPGAVAAGNTVTATTDLQADIGGMGGQIGADGFGMDGFVAPFGFNWQLRTARYPDGSPANLGDNPFGVPMDESRIFPASTAKLLGVDWTAHVVGVRQDMTIDVFDQMVISNAAGQVIFNAAQQDSKVMRVVFRLGFQTAIPVVRGEGGAQVSNANRYPASVLTV